MAAYVLVRGGQAAVVDTGVAGSADAIGKVLDSAGPGWAGVRHVVLTHKHPDHAGSVGDVLDRAEKAVGYVGAADLDEVDAPRRLRPLADGDDVFGLRIVATPGHTAGHMAVYDTGSRVLVAGDALNNTDGLAGSNPQFTEDEAEAARSVRRLAELRAADHPGRARRPDPGRRLRRPPASSPRLWADPATGPEGSSRSSRDNRRSPTGARLSPMSNEPYPGSTESAADDGPLDEPYEEPAGRDVRHLRRRAAVRAPRSTRSTPASSTTGSSTASSPGCGSTSGCWSWPRTRDLPLLERVRFLAIFASNLDEFFMVRVAGLKRRIAAGVAVRAASGLMPREVLDLIWSTAPRADGPARRVFREDIVPALAEEGIELVRWDDLDRGGADACKKLFKQRSSRC